MPNPELERLEALVATAVSRAYELGWTDALRKVVEELNARAPGGERIELGSMVEASPPEAAAAPLPEAAEAVPPVVAPGPEPEPPPEAATEPEWVFKPMVRPPKPWWARLRG